MVIWIVFTAVDSDVGIDPHHIPHAGACVGSGPSGQMGNKGLDKVSPIDPAAAAMRQCVEMCRDDDKSVDPVVQLRLREMLDFVERISRWYDQMIALPRSTIARLMKLGGGIARLLDRSGKKSGDLS
jgi:hypothetical protein